MIQFECPSIIENFIDFICNISMLLSPRISFTNHNVTFTIGTNPPAYINTVFNSSFRQIKATVEAPGNYNVTAYEKNYNQSLTKEITVNHSNKLKFNF